MNFRTLRVCSPPKTPFLQKSEKRIRVGCPAHNCGGRCLLIAHVRDGRIVQLDADDRPDSVAAPQLRACVRGRSYLRRQYHPDRLTQPLKRVGKRGSGEFRPISWEEALDTVASQMERVKREYGPSALFVPYGTGSYNQLNGSHVARRLMNLYGGCLGNLQLVFVGGNQSGNAHCLWHARHRQSAPGLAELKIHSDVGLEPGRDARWHQQ